MRVHTPTVGSEGWDAPHTLIDIVNDDMPFHRRFGDHGDRPSRPRRPPRRTPCARGGTLPATARSSTSTRHGESPGATRESWLHVEVDRETSADILDGVRDDLERVLGDVRAATSDWMNMLAAVDAVDAELDDRAPPIDPDELAEGRALLRWMAAQHFTFSGYRQYDLGRDADGGDLLSAVPGSGLGILRHRGTHAHTADSFSKLPAPIRAKAPRTDTARPDQGQRPFDRAPPDLPRLRRGQTLRRRRQRDRRAPVPRACSRHRPTRAVPSTSRCCAAKCPR